MYENSRPIAIKTKINRKPKPNIIHKNTLEYRKPIVSFSNTYQISKWTIIKDKNK